MLNLYALLGLSQDASQEEIAQALAEVEQNRKISEENAKFVREILLDADKRAEYDASLQTEASARTQEKPMEAKIISGWERLAYKATRKKAIIEFSSIFLIFLLIEACLWSKTLPAKVEFKQNMNFDNSDHIVLDYSYSWRNCSGGRHNVCDDFMGYTSSTTFFINARRFACDCRLDICHREPKGINPRAQIRLDGISLIRINRKNNCIVMGITYNGEHTDYQPKHQLSYKVYDAPKVLYAVYAFLVLVVFYVLFNYLVLARKVLLINEL